MGVSPRPPQAPVDGSGISVEVDAVPVVGEVVARAGVPLVARIVLSGVRRAGAAVVAVSAECDGVFLGPPVALTVDLQPGRAALLTDVGLLADGPLPPGRGTVDVRVSADGALLGAASVPVRVLAPGEWLAAPLPLALEQLPAFVRPDDPAVAALVGSATDLLRARTSAADAELVRPDPAGLDLTAAALVDALRRRAVRLDDARGGWADVPQRVRTPTEVLDGRIGSSLDLTVTLAAAFEQAGLRPLLWTADGHAFLGYWRTEQRAAAVPDVADLLPLVRSGAVQLVETTMLAGAAHPATFGDLHRIAAAAWLAGDAPAVLGVADVHSARADGVRPLPAPGPLRARRRSAAAAWVFPDELLDLRAEDPATAPVPLIPPPARLPELAARLEHGGVVTLLPADQLAPGQRSRGIARAADLPAHQLTDLLLQHGGLYTELPAAGYGPRCDALALAAGAAFERTGDPLLHLALGSLVWDLDGRTVRSPLVLLPVVLTTTEAGARRLQLDPAGSPVVNDRVLTELHRRTGLVVVPPDDGDLAALTSGTLHRLRSALASAGLPHRVEATAALALLPLAAHQRRQDAHRLPAEFVRSPLVAALVGHGTFRADADPADVDLDELAAWLPLPADGSQLRAIADACALDAFVLDGVAGTGKTHTVANLAAAAAAAGRRVLVVAAVQATRDRLAALLTPSPADHPADDDADALRAELRAARRVLADHRAQLHQPNSAGLSLYAAHAGSAAGDGPVLPVPPEFVVTASPRTVAAVRGVLAELPAVAHEARPGSPWGLVRSADLDPGDVAAAVRAVDEAVARLPGAGPLARVLAAVRTPADLHVLAVVLADPVVPVDQLDEAGRPGEDERVDALLAEVAAFAAAEHAGLDVAGPEALDLPLLTIAQAAQQAAAAGQLTRTRRLTEVRSELAPVLRPDADVLPAEVPVLADALLAVQERARDLAAGANAVPGVQVPWNWNPLLEPSLLAEQVRRLRALRSALAASGPFAAALRRYLLTDPAPDARLVHRLTAARRAGEALLAVLRVDVVDLVAWAGDDGLLPRWTATADARAIDEPGLPSLARWLDLLRHLHLLEAARLPEVREAVLTGAVRAADALAAFDRGLARASLAERSAAVTLDPSAAPRALERSLALLGRLRARALRSTSGIVLTTPGEVTRLPPEAGSFDLVVVEDAGLLPVVDALGALGRGRAAVVAGDSRGPAVPEDLLSACLRAGVPRRELSWQHRALVSGATFPTPGDSPGLSFVHGSVVDEVLRRVGTTVGVVVLSPAARLDLEAVLRADERTAAALADGSVEVRDIGQGTGRECDVGVLAVDGWGPLAAPGGERLLRAVVGRARREVVVVAPFDPASVRGGATSAAGVRLFRALVDVAGGAVPVVEVRPDLPDAHREEVADALRERGVEVAPDVGTSAFRVDLAVGRADGPPVLAVLLDGPVWAARETATDRDVVPAEALAARWPAVQRVWLPEWRADRTAVLDRLAAAVAAVPVAAAVEGDDEPDRAEFDWDDFDWDADDEPGEPVATTARPVLAPAVLPGEQPFRPWTPRPAGEPGVLRRLDDPAAVRAVRRVLAAGIRAEGPVHRERLAQLTAAAFGVARLSPARAEAVLALLPDPAAEYQWPRGVDPATWRGFRRQASHTERPLEHVPVEEVGNAMGALVRARAGLSREELFDDTLAVFGHRRRHPVLLPHLEAALSALVRDGRVTRAGDGLTST